jgi:class 3 adenylate cyclase
MEAPAIRYTRTADGEAIAYSVHGEGPPLLYNRSWSHLEAEWQIRETREWLETLGTEYTVVRYDSVGTGMSQRLEGLPAPSGRDAVAVLEDLGFDQVLYWGVGAAYTPESVATLSRVQSRVHRAVLWCPALTGAAPPAVQALRAVAEVDDDLYFNTLLLWHGWESEEGRRAMTALRKVSGQRDMAPEFFATSKERAVAAMGVLPNISVPTLVLARRDSIMQRPEDADETARLLPDAERRNLQGRAFYPEVGEPGELLEVLREYFNREGPMSPTRPGVPLPSSFQTILFTDLESSTALTQRLGDEGAQEVLRGHNTIVRKALESHGGREVKHTGDGVMAAFPSAVRAVEAALEVQRDLAGSEVRVRIGLNAGEPIAEDGDYFGTAVQLAARICDRAEPGQVLVSRVVADLCAGKKLQFSHHSDATLKGFAEPVALYEVS